MSDLAALVRGAIADLRNSGILADWLEDHSDPRGVLLRRRRRRWRTERSDNEAAVAICIEKGWTVWNTQRTEYPDEVFRKYIRRRFRDAFAIDLTTLTESTR